jgi:thiamine biosynthesis lipoprotein
MTLVGGHRLEHIMGTVISIDVRQQSCPETVLDELFAWFRTVDDTFSTYKADSDINRHARGEVTVAQCNPNVALVLDRCEDLFEATGGYFDARIGGGLDPSGFVKGWAAEVASGLLTEAGLVNHCINAGGDIRVAGQPEPGRGWRAGISNPHRPTALAVALTLRDGAVATSGTAERGCHVIDPHRGSPADELASVTVVGSDLGEADGYATAALAMGRRSLSWLESLRGHDAFVIDARGRQSWTSGFVRHSGRLPAAAELSGRRTKPTSTDLRRAEFAWSPHA